MPCWCPGWPARAIWRWCAYPMAWAVQVPLRVELVAAAQVEAGHALVVPDVVKHRPHRADALAVQRLPPGRIDRLPHALAGIAGINLPGVEVAHLARQRLLGMARRHWIRSDRRCVWRQRPCVRANRCWVRTTRRPCARMDKPKAVTAATHKLARLIYAMLTNGEEYTDRGRTTRRSTTASGSCPTSPRRPKPWACNSSLRQPRLKTSENNQLSGVS